MLPEAHENHNLCWAVCTESLHALLKLEIYQTQLSRLLTTNREGAPNILHKTELTLGPILFHKISRNTLKQKSYQKQEEKHKLKDHSKTQTEQISENKRKPQ